MNHEEKGPAARSPTDSEEVAKLKGELTRAAESMGDAVALHTHIHRLTEALKSASVALNVCQGWLLGLGRPQEAADADRWRDEAYQATLSQTCPMCGEGRHDGTCIDAALADASGDAPTAPLSPESPPPAPDLLLENARLRETLFAAQQSLIREGMERDAARAELTRARAAHLENATLLEKANAENTRLQGEVERLRLALDGAAASGSRSTKAWQDALAANTPLRGVVAAAEDGLSRVEAACARALAGDQKDWRTLRATLTLVIKRTQELRAAARDALESAPAVHSGTAPKAPLESISGPAKEGKQP